MRRILAVAIGALSLAHCSHTSSTDNSCATDAPCSHTIYVSENLNSFNADHDDFVIMVMDDFSPESIQRCLDYGGEPILNPRSMILYCEGIDF